MLDFNSKTHISDRINYHIDAAIAEQKEEQRKYLGASIVGHPCERAVQYNYMATLGLVDKQPVDPRVKRIFDRGNVYEQKAIGWLSAAGFVFGGHQHGFTDFQGAFSGHSDGVVVSGPDCGVAFPCLWECKCLQDKSFKAIVKDGLKKYSEAYWVQVHVYMAYLELERCLYTLVNANTMDLHHFVVELDIDVARQSRQRVERVLTATKLGEMVPRCTSDRNYFICKWCEFFSICWNK